MIEELKDKDFRHPNKMPYMLGLVVTIVIRKMNEIIKAVNKLENGRT